MAQNVNYAKMLGLNSNKAYPILFEDNSNKPRPRRYGKFNLPIGELVCDMTPKNGVCTKRVIAYIPLSSFTTNMLIGNDNNPREGIYSSKREGVFNTLFENPDYLTECPQGIKVICENLYTDNGKVFFEIPHSDITALDTEESQMRKRDINTRYGMFDGQNLFYQVLTFVRAIMKQDANVIKYSRIKRVEDLDKYYIQIDFRVYAKSVPNSMITYICKANNNNVAQNELNLLALDSSLNKYFEGIESAKKMVATKMGGEQYSISNVLANKDDVIQIDKDSFDVSDERDEELFQEYSRNGQIGLEDYIRKIALIHHTLEAKEKIKEIKTIPIKRGKLKTDDDTKVLMVYIDRIMYCTKQNVKGAVKEIIKAEKKGDGVSTYRYLFTPDLVNAFLSFYNHVLCMDYSDCKTEVLKNLAIFPAKDSIISPLTGERIKYTFSSMFLNFMPVIFGSLCEVVIGEDGLGSVRPMVDVEVFWDRNWSVIFDMMSTCYVEGTHAGFDKFCLYKKKCIYSYILWFNLLKLVYDYPKKAVGKGTRYPSVKKRSSEKSTAVEVEQTRGVGVVYG